jgi:microcystin-dependent protein
MAATVFQAPLPKFQFNQDGVPLAGGKLFTYASGTTTKLVTYTDATGTTPNTNPIILDVNGQCDIWLVSGSTYTFVLSPATDSDPPSNPFWTENGITGINDIPAPSNPTGTAGIVLQTGDVKFFSSASGNLATGWLLCTGAPVSRTTYATLFAAIGTTWGAGDTTTTFNLPDLRGRVPAGADNMGGTAANRITSASISSNAPAVLGASGGNQLAQTDTMTVTDTGHHHGIDNGAGTFVYNVGTSGGLSLSGTAGIQLNLSDTDTATTGVVVSSALLGNQQNVQPTLFGNWAIWSGGVLTNSIAVVPATTLSLGGVIIGPGVTVDAGGTITVAPGAGGVTAVVAGTGLEVGAGPGGTIIATGTLNITAATTAVAGGVIVGVGLAVSGGTIENAGILSMTAGPGVTLDLTTPNQPIIDNTGVLAVGGTAGSIVLGPNLSMTGQTLEVAGFGTGTVTSVATGVGLTGGPITGAGTIAIAAATATSLGGVIPGANMSVSGGTLTITAGVGTVTTLTSGTGITLTPSTITSTGTINNTGVITFGAAAGAIALGSNLSMSGQTLEVSAPGTGTVTSVTAGAGLSGGPITGAGTLANSGVLAVGATAGSIVLGANLSMTGQTLEVAGFGSGTITSLAAGSGITLTPSTITTGAGTISLSAPLSLALGGTGATTATAARVDINIGTVTVTPAGANFTITPTFGSSNVVLATMTSSGTLANPSGLAAGQTDLIVVNAGTSGTLTLAYGTAYLFNSPYTNSSPPAIGGGTNILTVFTQDGTVCNTVLQAGTWA